MSKIRSLGEIERKEQRRKRLSGIFIISLLLLSTLGFALSMVNFGGQNVAEEVQGFSNNGQYWIYTAGNQKYYFTYHVEELNSSSYNIDKTIADFGGKQVYVDSQIDGGLQEIYNTLGAYIGKITEACYGECSRDLPEKNCSETMIVLKPSETPAIREQDQCIFIEGDMKTLDYFLYKVLGITS